MATSTTNLGLTKPAGTDKIRIAQINGNMDILDEKIGAVGNTSLQAQVTSQNEAISPFVGTNVNWYNNVDLNNIKKSGYYPIGGTGLTNCPDGGWGMLSVIAIRQDTVEQIYYNTHNAVYTRELRSSSWSSWEQFGLKQTYEVKTYSIDCTTATNVGGKYGGTKDLSGLSEMTGVKAIVPMFARKAGYSYICTVEVESTTVRIQSDVSLEGVTVGILFIY